ncbi:MAG: TonB-dependent receptor [Niabella sp.]
MIGKISIQRWTVPLLCLLSIHINSKAQVASRTIFGTIVNEAKSPVSGANIQIDGANVGTVSDSKGVFMLKAPVSGLLIITHLNYAARTVMLTSETNYLITLKDSIQKMDEVVLIGYGTARKKDLTGAVQVVNLENSPLANLPNTNPILALSGTVAGITVPPQSRAGQDPLSSLVIRGEKSIDPSGGGLNRPLIVVDDIIFNGTINQINMQDVASINILKDASSAAIYGSRSANGVIIITTKKGKSGKPVFNINSSYGMQSWSRKPEMQMDIDKLLKNRWDYFINAGRIPVGTEFNHTLILTTQELEAYEKGITTNWLEEITQKAPVGNHNISVSGSGQNINYYLSGGLLDQKGVILNDNYKKVTFMTKLETNINKYITLGTKASYYSADNSGVAPSMQSATWMSPLSSTKTLTPGYENWIPSNPSGSSARNPIVGFDRQVGPAYGSDENKAQNIDGSGWLIVKAPWIPGLRYKFSINGTYTHSIYNFDVGPGLFVDTRNTANMDNAASFWNMAYATARATNVRTWVMDQVLTYNQSFGQHNVDAVAGYTRDAYRYNNLQSQGTGFNMPNPLKWNGIHLATTQTSVKSESAYQNVATLFRMNYNYAGKYYFTGTVRRDGFSGFAEGHKFGTFPGLSVGWTLSQESFMKNLSSINQLKIRLSWGQTGNQSISPYETLATMSSAFTVFGSTSNLAIYPNRMPNTDLSWSTTTTKNLGLDFGFLNNRISGSIDVYKSMTRDQLLSRSLPIMNGFTTVRTNIGRVDNKGIELVLNTVPIMGETPDALRWESGIIFSSNANKIIELYGTVDANGVASNDISNTPAGDAYIIGKPIHGVWDYKMLGIVQKEDEEYIKKFNAKPGDVKFLDYNNDGKLNSSDYHYLGTRDPLFIMNFNNTFTYKGFSLYFSFKWHAGDKEHYLGKDRYGRMSSMAIANGAQLKNVDPWTPENPTDKYPRVDWVNSMNYWFWNTRDFIKLKDLAFSYTFKPELLQRIKFQSLRVFVSGNNLFTLSKWTGLDPEDGGTIAANPGSIYYGSYPVLRTVTGGIVLSF